MTESASGTNRSRDYPRILGSNADEFHVPTVEQRRSERERDESHISLVAAALIFLVVDGLWALTSTVLLEDFRFASVTVLAFDLAVVVLTRSGGYAARAAVITRALLGIGVFGLEFAFFGASSAYVLGQLLIGAGGGVLSVGRGGEGRNVLGGTFAVVGVILAIVLGLVQEQGRTQAVVEHFFEAMELAAVGRTDQSQDVIDALLIENSDDARVYLIVSEYYSSQFVNDADSALRVALRATELSGGDLRAEALATVGAILATGGEFARALPYFEQAIELRDDDPVVHLMRGQTLGELGRERDALDEFRKVEDLAPNTDIAQQARMTRLQMEEPTFSRFIQAGE